MTQLSSPSYTTQIQLSSSSINNLLIFSSEFNSLPRIKNRKYRESTQRTMSSNASSSKPTTGIEKAVTNDDVLPHLSKQNIPFSELPREMRDMIYRHAISAGNLEILRTNTRAKEESIPFVSKHAVLRVNLGFAGRTNWVGLASGPAASVQHVEFRFSTGPGGIPFDGNLISGFAGKQIIRESCVIDLNYGKDGNPPFKCHHNMIYLHLARLKGFKRVTVKIVIEKQEFAEWEDIMTKEKFDRIFHYETALLSNHKSCYERVRKFFECSMGPGKVDYSVEDHHLEFHPLEPTPEGWRPELELNNDEDWLPV